MLTSWFLPDNDWPKDIWVQLMMNFWQKEMISADDFDKLLTCIASFWSYCLSNYRKTAIDKRVAAIQSLHCRQVVIYNWYLKLLLITFLQNSFWKLCYCEIKKRIQRLPSLKRILVLIEYYSKCPIILDTWWTPLSSPCLEIIMILARSRLTFSSQD